MKNIFNLIFIAFLIVFSACSDNGTSPDDTADAGDYFPMKIGNYWIYEYTELDKNSQPVGDIFIDSIAITGIRQFKVEDYYVFITFRNGAPLDTNYLMTDNFNINMIADEGNVGVPDLSDTVFNILQLYQSDWFIFNTKVDSMYIEFNGETHYGSGHFNFHGYRNYGDDTVYIYDKKYIALSVKVVSDRLYKLRDSTQTVFLHNQPVYYYYAKKIGPVVIRKEPHYITSENNKNVKYWFNGWRRQMIRTNLQQ